MAIPRVDMMKEYDNTRIAIESCATRAEVMGFWSDYAKTAGEEIKNYNNMKKDVEKYSDAIRGLEEKMSQLSRHHIDMLRPMEEIAAIRIFKIENGGELNV